jgi:hypothetical protein
MDDPFRDGIDPRYWNLHDFRKRREAEERTRQPRKRIRHRRSAAEMDLAYEIRQDLSRQGSHPSEWEPVSEYELRNLRAGDPIRIFRQTRKGWEPLKALNGVTNGERVLAFRRRNMPRRDSASGNSWETRFAYDEAVSRVFFHRSLQGHINKHGFPSAEHLSSRRHISLPEWEQIYANAEPIEPVQVNHWIGLILKDADGDPASGYAYRLRDSSGAVRQGKLNDQGEAEVRGLSDGPVEVTYGEPVDKQTLAAHRQAIQQELDLILQAEREETARIEAELQKKSLLGKAIADDNARTTGMRNAVWGILTGRKELSDLATQHLNHALGAAWETWRYRDQSHYAEQFVQRYTDAEFQELADVLGFDPRSLTREQWAEAQSLLNFIWHDEETQDLLRDFAKDYIKAQHGQELIETGFGIATEIVIGLLIAALTLGAGATVAVASKVRHADKLGRLGKTLVQLGKRLKQKAGSKETTSRTGKWLDQKLDKPENRKIEKGAVGEGVASHDPDISTTVRAGTSGPDTKWSQTTPAAEVGEKADVPRISDGTATDGYSQEAGKLVNALAENRSQVNQFLVPENNDRFSTMASDRFLERAGQITQANNSLVGMLDTLAATGIEVLNSSDGQFASMLQAASDEDGFNYLLFSAGLDQNQIEMSPGQLRLAIGSGILEGNERYLTEILPETRQFALDGKLHFDPADSIGGGNQAALDITNALSKGLGDIGQTSSAAGFIPLISFGQHLDFDNQERMLNNLSDYRLLPGDMKSDLLAQISTGRFDANRDGVFSGFGLFGKLGKTLLGIETATESASAEAGKKLRLRGVRGTKGGNLADALNDRIGRALGPDSTLLKPKQGSLTGKPELPHPNANADMVRSLTRQNESAELLANRGLDVTHLPNTGKKGGNPDLDIGGRPADVYSPKSKNPNTIRDNMVHKVEHQAPDIVLNLSDSPIPSSDMLKFLQDKPVDGLQNLYIIKGDDVLLTRY